VNVPIVKKKKTPKKKAMRSNGVLGRTDAAPKRIGAPRREVITLPKTRDETVKEIVQSEMPLCDTRFETGCCVFLIVIITACGVGIGLWYVNE
tara:strand:- start:2820 stop:3098 length:279 start_codon:yes stop_codon:yes gene_type:complete